MLGVYHAEDIRRNQEAPVTKTTTIEIQLPRTGGSQLAPQNPIDLTGRRRVPLWPSQARYLKRQRMGRGLGVSQTAKALGVPREMWVWWELGILPLPWNFDHEVIRKLTLPGGRSGDAPLGFESAWRTRANTRVGIDDVREAWGSIPALQRELKVHPDRHLYAWVESKETLAGGSQTSFCLHEKGLPVVVVEELAPSGEVPVVSLGILDPRWRPVARTARDLSRREVEYTWSNHLFIPLEAVICALHEIAPEFILALARAKAVRA